MLNRIARDPLVHFLLVGALLFAAYSWGGADRETESGDNRIVVDQAQLDHLTTLWRAQWKRDPAPSDLAAIIDRHLRQEVFYREALKMNLDHNDEIIRRRLAQKMEAVANDLSKLMDPPTEEQLRSFFHDREDLFELPRAFAFRQVLFLPREAAEPSRMEETLAALQQGAGIPSARLNKLGLPADWSLTAVATLDNSFGPGFADALDALPVGTWSGPVRSGYGWHLVLLEEKRDAVLPDFDEVRDIVARQYEYYSVLEAQERVYEELANNYEISITAETIPAEVRSLLAAR
jgi:peptidyl-prolyl cis-trans isomerase C